MLHLHDLEADGMFELPTYRGVVLRKVESLPCSHGDRTGYNSICLFPFSFQWTSQKYMGERAMKMKLLVSITMI